MRHADALADAVVESMPNAPGLRRGLRVLRALAVLDLSGASRSVSPVPRA